jgi:hypothetical protein
MDLGVAVVASEKGVVVGRLTYREDGDLIDCQRMGVGGKAIPPNVDKVCAFLWSQDPTRSRLPTQSHHSPRFQHLLPYPSGTNGMPTARVYTEFCGVHAVYRASGFIR